MFFRANLLACTEKTELDPSKADNTRIAMILFFKYSLDIHRRPVSESCASLAAFRMCSFDSKLLSCFRKINMMMMTTSPPWSHLGKASYQLSRQRMHSPASYATCCVMPTSNESNHSAAGTLHPHRSATIGINLDKKVEGPSPWRAQGTSL